ncbi:MAG: metal ABC transporter permease [Bdellovibrionales bacterium]|nr:metal ABC transporter permease [Bdellovibrionales bacterium]
MSEFIELMARPFLACLILAGIHAYLGLHVLAREVIFVDLALAQIAAFGASVGLLLGWGLDSFASYALALGFTLFGALLFALCRHRKPVVPQEAIIGISYAVAAAASILVLSRAPEGGEEFKNLLVGHLLFAEWDEIRTILLIYSLVGLVHWLVRKPLLLISTNPQKAFEQGVSVRFWDFIFYCTFGIVVTSSTKLAGVLVVFSFLIVPAVCGVLLGRSIRQRLWVGWVCGFVTSAVGVAVSFLADLPTGATVVCCFGATLALCAGLRRLRAGVA